MFVSAQVRSGPRAVDDVGGRPLNAWWRRCVHVAVLLARRWPLSVLLVVLAVSPLDYAAGGRPRAGVVRPAARRLRAGSLRLDAGPGVGLTCSPALVLAVDLPRLQDGDPLDEVLPGWFILGRRLWGSGRWMRQRRGESAGLCSPRAGAGARPGRGDPRRGGPRAGPDRPRAARPRRPHAWPSSCCRRRRRDRVLDADLEVAGAGAGGHRRDRSRGSGRAASVARRARSVDAEPTSSSRGRACDQLDDLVDRVRDARAARRAVGRRAAARRCLPASTSRRTGSCRRRSPTRSSTPAGPGAGRRALPAPRRSRSSVADDGAPRRRGRRPRRSRTDRHARAGRAVRRQGGGRARPAGRVPGPRRAARGGAT